MRRADAHPKASKLLLAHTVSVISHVNFVAEERNSTVPSIRIVGILNQLSERNMWLTD